MRTPIAKRSNARSHSHSTWLYSRSRNELWNKGATSGNTQRVVAVAVDCDADALSIASCRPVRPATPARVVLHRGGAAADDADAAPGGAALRRRRSANSRARSRSASAHPRRGSYTAKLFAGGVDRIGKKIGEEATEVVIAAKNDDRSELIWETADLLYHTLVLLAEREIALDEVGAELTRRATPKT